MSRPTSALRVEESLVNNSENALAGKIGKTSALPSGKQQLGQPATRKFGTSLSVNSNVQSAPSAAVGKAAVPSATIPSKPILASCIPQTSISTMFVDNVTAADIAGAMDIDISDRFNEMAVTDYVDDIYVNLRKKEMELAPPVNYMSSQEDINDKMRTILVDWLIEVHLKFKLRHETLFLTVNILDRFLAVQKVARQRLQLVGVTSLALAAKYEEVYPPEMRDYVYICDNAYTKDQIVQMEQLILTKLNFRLTVPTQRSYLKRFCKAAQGDAKLLMLISYLMELTLIESSALAFRPSEICAAATHLALRLSGQAGWSPTLSKYTRYLPSDLQAATRFLEGIHVKASEGTAAQKAAYKKYASPRFHAVSAIPPLPPAGSC